MLDRHLALWTACEAGDVATVEQNIAAGRHDVDGYASLGHIDPRGWRRSPLHVAIQHGHFALAQWLLDHGADPNARTTFGDTPLAAVLAPPLPGHYVEATRLLMAHRADPTIPNEEGETALRHAQRTSAIWQVLGPMLSQHAVLATVDQAQRFSLLEATQHGQLQYYLTVAPPADIEQRGASADTIVGTLKSLPESFATMSPDTFVPNERFVRLLHEVIGSRGPEQPGLQYEAARIGQGHVFIIDQRGPTPSGRVPPEDILGYFTVADGIIITDSYRSNANYRVLTERGLMRLHSELHAALVAELRARS